MLREVGSTAGGQVAKRIFSEVDEMQHYPDKYSQSEEARLGALKAIHTRFLGPVPDRWTLDPDNKTPHRMLMDGTWEKHWKRALREKKITPLRGEVENMLYVISGFLDERRKKIWRYVNVNGIKKGDVEEQFFGEMMIWLKDILDSSFDEMLEEKITRQQAYLYEVLMSMEVFPKQHIHDKSESKKIVSKLYDMLGETIGEVKKIQAQQFTLRKFEEISIATKTMIQHFLKGFSHFSPILRELDGLKVSDLQQAIERSDTRFAQLFLLFAQNFYQDSFDLSMDDEKLECARGVFDPRQFTTCMQDETRQLGLSKNMPKELAEAMPEIFESAYQVSKAMRLIREASSTLSEQGTIQLFCNNEGRNYFEFLLEDFKSIKDAFVSKIAWFNGKCMAYAQKKVARTGENPSKDSEIGQYDRFRESCMDVQSDNTALNSHLENASKQIRSFAGKTPEYAESRRERLYAMIRERMRASNQGELADALETLSVERIAKAKVALQPSFERDNASPAYEEKSEGFESVPLTPISGVGAASSRPSLPYDFMSEEMKQKMVAQEKYIREKIKEALVRLQTHYDTGFFGNLVRSTITTSFADELIKTLEDSSTFPLRAVHGLIRDFIASVKDANDKTRNVYVGEEFYLVASELYFLLSDPAYIGVVFPEAEVEALTHTLSILKVEKEKLEEKVAENNTLLSLKNQEIQTQLAHIQKDKAVISNLNCLVAEKKGEIVDMQLNIAGKVEEIRILEQAKSKLEEKIDQLERNGEIQQEKLEALDKKMLQKEVELPGMIRAHMAEWMKQMSASHPASNASEDSPPSLSFG